MPGLVLGICVSLVRAKIGILCAPFFGLNIARSPRHVGDQITSAPSIGTAGRWPRSCRVTDGGVCPRKLVYRVLKLTIPMLAGVAALASLAFATSDAHAEILDYSLTNDMCGGSGCGTTPFGEVTVSTVNSTTVEVKLTLGSNNPIEVFARTGALNKETLEFSITGDPTISTFTVNSPPTPSAFKFGLDSTKPDAAGVYSVSCTSCGSGTSNTTTGPLDFDISVAAGLTPEDFIQGGTSSGKLQGNFFAVDIGTGCTGPGAHNSYQSCTTGVVGAPTAVVVPAPLIGHGLPALMAVGGIFFGAKLWDRSSKRRSPGTALHAAT
jgi:hypothetical protein